jgi:hypothetical protein
VRKKATSILLSLALLLGIFAPLISTSASASSIPYYPKSNVQIKAGDILITNSTSVKGLTGHASIVVLNKGVLSVLHIQGKGYLPRIISISDWVKSYPNTKVIRYKDSIKAEKASAWAVSTYSGKGKGANATYAIGIDFYDYDYATYCSKIPAQAFYYGANSDLFGMTKVFGKPIGTIRPYDFIDNPSTGLKQVLIIGKNFSKF